MQPDPQRRAEHESQHDDAHDQNGAGRRRDDDGKNAQEDVDLRVGWSAIRRVDDGHGVWTGDIFAEKIDFPSALNLGHIRY